MNILLFISTFLLFGATYPQAASHLENNIIYTSEQLAYTESIQSYQKPDSTKIFNKIILKDSISRDTISETISNVSNEIKERTALVLFEIPNSEKFLKWNFNATFLSSEVSKIDTSLWMTHLIYPQQRRYESYTYLGNLGSPTQPDHFFSRDNRSLFLFSKHFKDYSKRDIEGDQYNVKTPLTNLFYSTGGTRNEAEQIFKVFHTQNLSKYFNLGVRYNFFGTKGVYANQETRDNLISFFGNYYKGNIQSQFSFSNKVFVNQENGGIHGHSLITDSTYNEINFIPVWLNDAESITRERSVFAMFGYTILNVKKKLKNIDSDSIQYKYIPLLTGKILFNHERFSRVFSDLSPDSSYYQNFFINPLYTRDSVSLVSTEAKAIIEIAQFAKFPGMPGLRAWLGYDNYKYNYFRPDNFLYGLNEESTSTSHIGIAAFSESPYFSYNGAARVYFEGYKSDDKEIIGNIRLSPWRNPDMPQLRGDILISESTPDIFLNNYFSNNFRWDNSLEKEKRFKLGASLEAKKWEFLVGYNLMHIRDFIYFNENAMPSQTADITITSAFIQKNIRFWNGFNLFNRVVWQANTNSEVLSLPTFSSFSTFFYERVVVKNALTAQLGLNVVFRTRFYADAFQPATAQFYKQRIEEVGDYPLVDVFANFKWKRALIFVKYEHLNQGYPDNQYFATYLYPMNPQVFKFGVSWTFYD